MTIREYVDSDYEQLISLMRSFKNEENNYSTDKYAVDISDDETARAYTDLSVNDVTEKEGMIYVAENDGKIVGFITSITGSFGEENPYAKLTHKGHKVGWIGIIFIEKEFRGRSLATELIEKQKTFLKSKGCDVVKLNVLAENPAVNIYKKLGFRADGIQMMQDLDK